MRPLKYKKFWFCLGLVYLLLIVYFSLIPEPPQLVEFEQSDKIKHLLVYSLLMFYFAQLYAPLPMRIRLAIIFILMGIALEIFQGFTGSRSPEILDAIFNSAGVAAGFWAGSRLPLYKLLPKA